MPDGRIDVLGIQLDAVPRWVVALAGLAAAGAIVLGAYATYWRQPERTLVSLQEANTALQAEVDEFNRHIAEEPESQATLLDDARGRLRVLRYADGCVLLARTAAGTSRSKLVIDLARDKDLGPSRLSSGDLTDLLETPVAAQGRCLVPHPGQFRTWYGARKDCLVEVWREWPDGCRQVQILDSCHGTFETDVRWTSCVH